MREEGRARPPWTVLALLVGIKVGLTMAVAGRYGWHRDELYYLASSKHLALGYVDYPPVTPLLAAIDQLIFPRSLPGLRLLTILAGAAVIVIAALMARELRGSPTAQALAGLAVLISPLYLGANLLFQTVSFDQLIWALACWLFIRIVMAGGDNPRDWLLLGVVFGLGLETKYTIIGLGVAMLVALLLTGRHLLRSRWPWLGLAIALVMLAPNLAWQATHHWDSIAYTVNHRGATDGPVLYWLQQLLLAGAQMVPIVVMGVVWLWRRDVLRTAAVLVIAVELLFFLAGGKAYYPAPIFPLTYAAGSVWFVFVTNHPFLKRWTQPWLVAAACLVSVFLLPLGLPVLPAPTVPDWMWGARKDYADMVGWPDLSQQVTAVYQQLSPAERGSVMILAGNYGEAGALDYYGHDLPTVVCAHLTFYYWAPAQMAPATLIVVGYPRDYLATYFGSDLQQAATVRNSLGVHNEEWGKAIWIIRHPPQTLSAVWPQLKSLD